MLCAERSLSQTAVSEWLVECQLKMTNVQSDQAPAKRQKVLGKFSNSFMNTIAEQSMSSADTTGISFRVCQES
jgi:hypothetical protein